MHVPVRIPLLAAALAALIAASAPAQQVHLGRPLSLEGGDASVEMRSEPDAEANGDETFEVGQSKPVDPAVASIESVESNPLGRPQNLLASARLGGHEGEGAATRERDGAAMFGGIRGDAFHVISALALVLGLAFGLRTLMLRNAHRFGGGGRPSGVLEILARYPVARGQHLILLKMARRILLVHQSGPSMRTLSEISDPDEVAAFLARIEAGSASPREASRFRSLLTQFNREHESPSTPSDHAGIKDAWNEGEVVDLTKKPRRGLAGLFSRSEGAP